MMSIVNDDDDDDDEIGGERRDEIQKEMRQCTGCTSECI